MLELLWVRPLSILLIVHVQQELQSLAHILLPNLLEKLVQRLPQRLLQLSIIRATQLGAVKFGTDALAKPAAKCSAKAGTKAVAKVSAATTDVTTETVFQLGYTAALSGTAIGIIAGVAVAINIAIEGPLLARSVYKLHRKKKFDQISKVEFERGIVQESITSANAVAGAVVGAVVGQAAIPVPVLGAAVGGGVGGAVGQLCGRVEGLAIGKVMFEQRAVTLPPLVKTSFIDNPPPGK